ncbi:hypothetical protein ACHABX_02675 [Nesterenkonia halotolerans]|uniref:hypothetical protein n=1 Tax=Nesterenkonia halotolerans TaxID=225325 RepID=UPI003EE463E2
MAETTDDTALVTKLAEYVQADPSGEQAYLASCTAEAQAMVSQHTGTATVPDPIKARAVLEVAADLYYRRKTRNGVADFADLEGAAPIRVARDPMTAAYPLLRPYVGLGFA